MSPSDLVLAERRGDVAVLTLNDEKTLNALSLEMARALIEALREAARGSRAVLLTGAGKAFSSGANLSPENIDFQSGDFDVGQTLEDVYNPMMLALHELEVPLVTAVPGAAAGIGSSVALMGDLIYAAPEAYFLQAFCNIGLVPDGGAPWLLQRAVGRARAMELMLLGEKYRAPDAAREGLINAVVDRDALLEHALGIAARLAAGPTRALGMIRRSAWAAQEQDFAAQLRLERALQRDAGRTQDCAEGVGAFLQKRKPAFKGR